MKQHLLFCTLIILTLITTTGSLKAYAQDEQAFLGNSRYIDISAGLGLSRLRDFATSPLFYEGIAHRYAVSLSRMSERRDISTGFAFLTSNLENDYNEHAAESALKTLSVHHSRLYQIFGNGSERWNLKAGGELNATANLRINRSLLNSAVGIEAFPILFGTLKATRNITRQSSRRGKEPKTKSLSFKLNASLIGASVRNGYSYLGIGQVINKSGFDGLLDDYQVKAFGVSSLATTLDYTIWLKNKNGWRFSYAWDAYKTSRDFADFEMASHTFRVTLLFNTKNN
jgi:hypothetical protein